MPEIDQIPSMWDRDWAESIEKLKQALMQSYLDMRYLAQSTGSSYARTATERLDRELIGFDIPHEELKW